MRRSFRFALTVLGGVALAPALAACPVVVTAAVTEAEKVTPQPFGPYEVVVDREDRPQTFTNTTLFPDLGKCQAGIKGIDRYLAEVAQLDPRGALDTPLYEPVDADQSIRASVAYLVVAILEREKYARMPTLTISCVPKGPPAPPKRFVCTRNQFEAGECEPQTEK